MTARLLRAALAALMVSVAAEAAARELFVASGAGGNGTDRAPFGAVQAALLVARPGDTVIVRPGTYREQVQTVRHGRLDAPITLRAENGRGTVVITAPGTVLQVNHSFFIVEHVVVDAAYAARKAVSVSAGVQSFVLRGAEVRRSSRDCVDIGAAVNVLVEDSLIHHCLNPIGGRTDAHGIVAGAVRGLTVRGTDIHTFSGDAIQLNRTGTAFAAGWDDVLIERCRFWLAPLDQAENGFAAGAVPGENAVDTKVASASRRATITIRDTHAWGFGGGVIRLQAAFNLKENIDATVDRVTVWDSDIAFRVRGSTARTVGAWVRIQNVVLHDVSVGIRYENDIQRLRVWNTTFGRGVVRPFAEAASKLGIPDVRNAAILGARLPPEAAAPSNRAVSQNDFVDIRTHDYRLTPQSRAIDTGTTIGDVAVDRAGVARPHGRGYDVGAYEWCTPGCTTQAR